ncbi:MAG: Pycsar system effector family protein, partial [Armatimonadota bacterium]
TSLSGDDLTREERLLFLRHTYDGVDEQIRFANSKASYILATVGCVFVGCGAALLGPEIKSEIAKVVLMVGLVLTSLSGAAACVTVFPMMRRRQKNAPGRSLMFFGAISVMTPREYADAVESLTEPQIYDEMCQAIHALSCLAKEKYHWIRISTSILAVGLVFSFAAFVVIFMR